jgi:hypothetical protein
MINLGDRRRSSSITFKFSTKGTTQAPITLAGTPAISVYKEGSTTETTTGVTLTVDYDTRTGMHNVVIDTSADTTFYAPNNDFQVVITTGTVDGVSVVGTVIAQFSIEKFYMGDAYIGTAQSAGAQTLELQAADTGRAGDYVEIISATTGAQQLNQLVSLVSGDNWNLARAWDTTPTGTIIYRRSAGFLPSTNAEIASAVRTELTTELARIDAAVSTRAAPGDSGFKKNTAFNNFMIQLRDSTNHLPKTGATVTATRSLDGAAFGACANAVTEVSNGWYKINLAASDLNADAVAFKFTATATDQLDLFFRTT